MPGLPKAVVATVSLRGHGRDEAAPWTKTPAKGRTSLPSFSDGQSSRAEALSLHYAPDPAPPPSPLRRPLRGCGPHSSWQVDSIQGLRFSMETSISEIPSASPPTLWLVGEILDRVQGTQRSPMDSLPSRPPLGEKEFCRPDKPSQGESLGLHVGQCVRDGDNGCRSRCSFLESPVSVSYRELERQGEEPSLSRISKLQQSHLLATG